MAVRKPAIALLAGGLVLLVVLVLATAPVRVAPSADPVAGEADKGRVLYLAGGCLGCHKPSADEEGRDPQLPSGGHPLPSRVGTFFAPNITPDPATGIGGWSFADFVSAMVEGTSPDGRHYFPAFPYASYRLMTEEDLAHLFAYLKSLPPVEAADRPHDLFAGDFARSFLGVWKAMAFEAEGPLLSPGMSGLERRGAYLVQGPGHCGECHTPRNLLFVKDGTRSLQGGPHPDGKGNVPSLVGLIERGEYKDAAALKEAFEYGEMFGYDGMSSGGMGEVQGNLARLPSEDLDAIVAYLVSLKP